MSKVYYSDKVVKGWLHNIIRDMSHDGWRPDYIVGLNRGGLIPATMLSHYLNVPMHTLDVSFRDNSTGPESNLWMAEEAFGYVNFEDRIDPEQVTTLDARYNILIVDDINDTGRTLNWIKEDWRSGCMPDHPEWENIWNNTVRFAALIHNTASDFDSVDYLGIEINKLENPVWCVFPWENWWE